MATFTSSENLTLPEQWPFFGRIQTLFEGPGNLRWWIGSIKLRMGGVIWHILYNVISNFEPRANLQITVTNSEIKPWSAISLNYASKLIPPRSVSHTPHQADTVNIQTNIVSIRAPKRALKSANVNTRSAKRSLKSAKVNTNFRPNFNFKFYKANCIILFSDSLESFS